MLYLLGYFGILLMGITLGIIGGGGSIIALPILVYLFKIPADEAIVYSLFIIGCTSIFASINNIKQKNFDIVTACKFGAASVLMVAATRSFLVPSIPTILFTFNKINIYKSAVLLLLFAILMLVASLKMIDNNTATNANTKPNSLLLIIRGAAIGVLTGLIGAGGGFLIVPTLIYHANLTVKKAIGTSLLIIGANSLIGFGISTIHTPVHNWQQLSTFISIAITGAVIGMAVSKKISNQKLKIIFGWFVLVTGLYIIVKELFFN
jgi:uncharacterized membrane protein YfcA